MADFGKLNFSISFNPTAAFPLDARYYFESYAAAEAAAKQAEQVGSSNTVYYYGETLCVVENDLAKLYVIQPDNTLSPLGGDVQIDTSVFEKKSDGSLSLLGFSTAVEGAQLVKDAEGKISWQKPDSTTVEGLSSSLATIESVLYDKTDADTQEVTPGLVSRVGNLEKAQAEHIIASVSDEFEIITDQGKDRELNLIGIDQSKVIGLDTALAGKVDVVDGSRLITQEEVTKLESITSGAEPNFITSVDTSTFSVDSDGKLSLVASGISSSQILVSEEAGSLQDVLEGDGTEENPGLISIINGLDSTYVTLDTYSSEVGDLSKLLSEDKTSTTIVDEITNINDEITNINKSIAWHELEE